MNNNIEDIIEGQKRIFAKSYANTHPHEYIVKFKCSNPEEFDLLCEHIQKNGHYEFFFNKRGIYCSIGDYTYWVMGNVINRRWNSIYFLTPTKQIQKVDNWKEILINGGILHE